MIFCVDRPKVEQESMEGKGRNSAFCGFFRVVVGVVVVVVVFIFFLSVGLILQGDLLQSQSKVAAIARARSGSACPLVTDLFRRAKQKKKNKKK